jgi:hypothetical protein
MPAASLNALTHLKAAVVDGVAIGVHHLDWQAVQQPAHATLQQLRAVGHQRGSRAGHQLDGQLVRRQHRAATVARLVPVCVWRTHAWV